MPILLFAGWMGAPGVLIGQAIGGAVFAVISIWLVARVMNKAKGPAPPRVFQREARAMQLFNLRR